MTDNQKPNRLTEAEQPDIFPPFPAPRVWDFGGDYWTGVTLQRDTSDFMLSDPVPDDIRLSTSQRKTV